MVSKSLHKRNSKRYPLDRSEPMRRRTFLADLGMGCTGLALGALLRRDGIVRANEPSLITAPTGEPHFAPKAKSVIWLLMLGGVSHLESFDPKPALNRYAGKSLHEAPLKNIVVDSPFYKRQVRESSVGIDRHRMEILPLQIGYRQHGESGIAVSDWWPYVAECVDDLAIVRSMWTTNNDHAAQLQMQTGRHAFEGFFPTIGSWVHYGLGTLNENLPQFVVLGTSPADGFGGTRCHGADYLGPEHSGVPLAVEKDSPIAYLAPGQGEFREEDEAQLELLRELNALGAVEYPADPMLRARIKSYELAAGMQLSVPEVLSLEQETAATQRLYGLDDSQTQSFGRLCLSARKLVENGVRFVQLYHQGVGDDSQTWDGHMQMKKGHTLMCGQVDKPIAALLTDLKQRGLLDETLVVWTTEFGRTPGTEGTLGRDHHPYGFSIWMAGGGTKGGIVHGATDELGFHAVEDRHYVTDLHATVMHQLGLDSRRLEIPGHKRLEIDHGKPIEQVIL